MGEKEEKVFEEIIAESFPNLMKTINSKFKKLWVREGGTKGEKQKKLRKLYQGTSQSNCLKPLIKRKF